MSPPAQQQPSQPQPHLEAEKALLQAGPEAFDLSGPALARALNGPLSGKGSGAARKQQHMPTFSVEARVPVGGPTGVLAAVAAAVAGDAARVGVVDKFAAAQPSPTGVRCVFLLVVHPAVLLALDVPLLLPSFT